MVENSGYAYTWLVRRGCERIHGSYHLTSFGTFLIILARPSSLSSHLWWSGFIGYQVFKHPGLVVLSKTYNTGLGMTV
jgi:hypothetical protein